MANDGKWRTPHFQQKWKGGGTMKIVYDNYYSFNCLLGDLPKFCSENFPPPKKKKKKQVNGFVYFSVHVTFIEQRMKIRSRADVKYSCK